MLGHRHSYIIVIKPKYYCLKLKEETFICCQAEERKNWRIRGKYWYNTKRNQRRNRGDGLDFSFLALSEEFVNDKGYNNHQLNIIYKTIYNKPITESKFKGLEGDWINFEWVNISEIDNYAIYPKGIKNAIKDPEKVYHFTENLIK